MASGGEIAPGTEIPAPRKHAPLTKRSGEHRLGGAAEASHLKRLRTMQVRGLVAACTGLATLRCTRWVPGWVSLWATQWDLTRRCCPAFSARAACMHAPQRTLLALH